MTNEKKIFYFNIDLAKNILFNARLHPVTDIEMTNLASSLTVDDEGFVLYNFSQKFYYGWTGNTFKKIGIDSFLGLSDTPDTFVPNKYLKVKSDGSGIEFVDITIPQQLQSDWNQSDNNQVDFIKNKPFIPSIAGLVPYTGANQNVDLGEYSLKVGKIEFDLTPTGNIGVGVFKWNDVDGTLDLGLKGGSVILQLGQEQLTRVVNKTSPSIDLLESNYQVVKIVGATGQRLSVALAQADSSLHSMTTLGVVTENINHNQEGFITTSGQVNNINTTGSLQGETWNDGDVLYLSATTPGALTKNRPAAPNKAVVIGYVEYAHSQHGKIFVKVDVGLKTDDIDDVTLTNIADNQGLFYNSTTQVWENKTITTVLGYIPQTQLNGIGFVKANGTSITYDNNTYLISNNVTTNQIPYGNGANSVTGSDRFVYNNNNLIVGASNIDVLGLSSNRSNIAAVWDGTTGSGLAGIRLITYDNSLNPTLQFAKSRGTINSPSPILSGDPLGFINQTGWNGTSWTQGGNAGFIATENWSSTNAGTRFQIAINANGTNNLGRLYTFDANAFATNFNNVTDLGNSNNLFRRVFANAIQATNNLNISQLNTPSTSSTLTLIGGDNNAASANFIIRRLDNTAGFQISNTGRFSSGMTSLPNAALQCQVIGNIQIGDAETFIGFAGILRLRSSTDNFLTLQRTGVKGWGLDINSSGTFQIVDRDASLARLQINTAGRTLLNGATDNTAAILNIGGTNGGVLPPRLTNTQVSSLATPPTGLELFNTDVNRPSYRDSTGWKNVANTDDVAAAQAGTQLFLSMNFI